MHFYFSSGFERPSKSKTCVEIAGTHVKGANGGTNGVSSACLCCFRLMPLLGLSYATPTAHKDRHLYFLLLSLSLPF